MGPKKEYNLALQLINERLDMLLREVVSLGDKVEVLEKQVCNQTGKLTDKLIEMAMVKGGDAPSAVAYRGQVRLDTSSPEVGTREWLEGDSSEDWPKGNADIMGIS